MTALIELKIVCGSSLKSGESDFLHLARPATTPLKIRAMHLRRGRSHARTTGAYRRKNEATSWRLNASGGLLPNDARGARAQPPFRSERSSHCAFHQESFAVHEADRLEYYESLLTSANRMNR